MTSAPTVPLISDGVIGTITAALDDHGLRLRKAVPASLDDPGPGLLLEAEPLARLGPAVDPRLATAGVMAGRWLPDVALADRLARRLGPDAVRGDDPRLVVQAHGADPKLPALRPALIAPGAVVVAHRSGKRAVVRDHDGHLKILRAGRAPGIARALAAGADTDAFRTPRVVAVDEVADTVRMATLAGVALHDRLGDPTLADRAVAADLHTVGIALRRWHDAEPAGTAGSARVRGSVHDAAAELDVTRRWLRAAQASGVLADVDAAVARAERAMPLAPVTLRRAHRDLHDKQLLVAPDQPIGLLDLDLATVADPALDVANLLVHLQLRAWQGHCSAARAELAADAFLDGYRVDRALHERIDGYATATRLRLAAVYAFRATPTAVIDTLLAG